MGGRGRVDLSITGFAAAIVEGRLWKIRVSIPNLKESGEVILRENELVDPMPPRKASKVRTGDRTVNRHR